jgi:hypothetical protein
MVSSNFIIDKQRSHLSHPKSDRPLTSPKKRTACSSAGAIALSHPQKAISKGDTYYYLNSKASHERYGTI